MRKIIVIAMAALVVLFLATAGAEEQPRELAWDDLIPTDFQFKNPLDDLSPEELNSLDDSSPLAQELMQKMEAARASAPVVEALNGQHVKLPGFAIPLESDGVVTTEFLLVPYFGACIHVPPPPANQIVHVKSEQGVKIDDLWDPVWAIGEISTEHTSSALAESGYRLQATAIEPYQL